MLAKIFSASRVGLQAVLITVEVEKLSNQQDLEDSKTIRNRVESARETQRKRFEGTKIFTNSEMSSAQIKQYAKLNQEAVDLLKMAIVKMNLSARGYIKIIKLARTIADLAGSESILSEHLAESLTYRASSESI